MGRIFSFQGNHTYFLTFFISISRYSQKLEKAFLLVLVICSIGCSRNGQKKVRLLSKKDFINLLVDIHLADGILQQDYNYSTPTLFLDSTRFYDGIFHKYGVTKVNFDSTMKFYSRHPKDFDLVYDEVIRKLSKMEGKLINEQKKLELNINKKNLWKTIKDWRFPKDGKNLCLSFSIPIKQLGIYRVSSKVKIYADDKSTNTRMIAWYWHKDSTKLGHFDYFQPKNYIKNGSEMTYSISKELKDTCVTHLKGFILFSDNLKFKVLRHMEIHELEIINTSTTPNHP